MATGGTLGGAWQQAYNEMQGGAEGGGCGECSSGRMCECAKLCRSKCKRKFKEKVQCAYAVGFAVCLVFVLFIWMMWPMLGSAVASFKNGFTSSASVSGAYAPNPPAQYMPCRSFIDQGLPLTQTSGYLNGVNNEPGATNGRQMSAKYQMGIDHPGTYDATTDAGSQMVQSDPTTKAEAAKEEARFGSKLGFQSGQHGSPFDSKLGFQSGPQGSPFDSKLGFQSGQQGSPFDSKLGFQSGQQGSHFDSKLGFQSGPQESHFDSKLGFQSGQHHPVAQSGFSQRKFSSDKSGFIGGTSAQYPSEWATPGRDEDITEMTLRCATQHQYGDVPTQLPAAAAASAASAAAAAPGSKPAGFHGFWPW